MRLHSIVFAVLPLLVAACADATDKPPPADAAEGHGEIADNDVAAPIDADVAAPADTQIDEPADGQLLDEDSDIPGSTDAVDVEPQDTGWPDDVAAPDLLLTVNGLPRAMNGSQPIGQTAFQHRVNARGFTIDAQAAKSGGPAFWDSLTIACAVDGQTISLPQPGQPTDDGWRTVVLGPDDAFPIAATVACEATLTGPGGTSTDAVVFESALIPAHLDPFAELDRWLVTTSRDMFRLVVTPLPDGTFGVTSLFEPQGNGIVDIDEAFIALGLFSSNNGEAAAVVKQHLLTVVRQQAYRIFGLGPDGGPDDGRCADAAVVRRRFNSAKPDDV